MQGADYQQRCLPGNVTGNVLGLYFSTMHNSFSHGKLILGYHNSLSAHPNTKTGVCNVRNALTEKNTER